MRLDNFLKQRTCVGSILAASLVVLLTGAGRLQAQTTAAPSTSVPAPQGSSDLAMQSSNPVSTVWLIQTQENDTSVTMEPGKGAEIQSDLLIQPVTPVPINDMLTVLIRPVIPMYNSQPFPDQVGNSQRQTGFGDTILAFGVAGTPKLTGKWIVGTGVTFIFPTATNSALGQHKRQFGPVFAGGITSKHTLAYIFVQQWFPIGGDGKRTDHLIAQYAFSYFFKDGWAIGTDPSISVDWTASRGNQLTFPVGLQVGKLTKLGPLPVKFELQGLYYPVHPEVLGQKWGVQLNITPIIPSLIHGKSGRKA